MAKIKIEGLKPNTQYQFYIVAEDGTVQSPPSGIYTFTTAGDTTPPDPPSNVVIDFTTTTFSMKWDGPDITNTPDFYDYKIVLTNQGQTASQTLYVKDRLLDFTLDQNRTLFGSPTASIYAYLQSRDTSGNLSAVVSASGFNPAPTDYPTITASGIVVGLSASWGNTPASFSDYSYTEVYATTSSTYNASAVSPVWRGVANNMQYSPIFDYVPWYVKGRHFDVFGQAGPDGPTSSATPINPDQTDLVAPYAPQVVGASFNKTTLEVYFNKPALNEDSTTCTDLKDFKILLYSTSTASPVIYQNADTTATQQIFRFTLDQNSSYFGTPQSTINGTIVSRDTAGNISTASTASFTAVGTFTAPSVTYLTQAWPGTSNGGLTAGALNYTVTWDDVSACPAFGYTIVTGSNVASGSAIVYQGAGNSVTVNALANTNWVNVQHFTIFGASGTKSATASVVPTNPVVVDTNPPTNASGITASAYNSSGAVGLSGYIFASWTPSADSSTRGYRLRVAPFDGDYWQYEDTSSSTTNYTISGLVPGANYKVQIAAYDELGNTSSYTAMTSPSTVLVPYATSSVVSYSATATANASVIVLSATTASAYIGHAMAGYGLQSGTRITAVTGASATISQNTASAISGSTVYLYAGVADWKSYISAGTSPVMKLGTGVSGTNSGLYIDANNYWYNNGNFRVGASNVYLSWDNTTLFVTGSINATGGSFTGNVFVGSNGALVTTGAAGSVVVTSAGISASNASGQTFAVKSSDGTILANAGTVGGWTLSSASLTGGNVNLHSSGSAQFGSGANSVFLSATDATYRIWAGNATPANAAFSVTQTGVVKANSASITGDVTANDGYFRGSLGANTLTLTGNQFLFGSIIAATASAITAASSNGTSASIYGAAGAFPYIVGSKVNVGGVGRFYDGSNLTVTAVGSWASGSWFSYTPSPAPASGVATLSNAYTTFTASGQRVNFNASGVFGYDSSGSQTFALSSNAAIESKIANFTFTSSALYSINSSSAVGFFAPPTPVGADVAIWAGAALASRTTAPFRVNYGGSVTAQAGTIGGWILGSTSLYNSSGLNFVGLATTGTYSIFAGATDSSGTSPKFSVTPAGAMVATNASVTGTITASAGTVGGWTLSTNALTSSSAVGNNTLITYLRTPNSIALSSSSADYLWSVNLFNTVSNYSAYDRAMYSPSASYTGASVQPIIFHKIGGYTSEGSTSAEAIINLFGKIPTAYLTEIGSSSSFNSTYSGRTGIVMRGASGTTFSDWCFLAVDPAGNLFIDSEAYIKMQPNQQLLIGTGGTLGTPAVQSILHTDFPAAGGVANVNASYVQGGDGRYRYVFRLISSSLKQKTLIGNYRISLQDFMSIKPRLFSWKDDQLNRPRGGFILEEFAEIPALDPFINLAPNGENQSIDYGGMVALLTDVVQQQQNLISQLESRITALENN